MTTTDLSLLIISIAQMLISIAQWIVATRRRW